MWTLTCEQKRPEQPGRPGWLWRSAERSSPPGLLPRPRLFLGHSGQAEHRGARASKVKYAHGDLPRIWEHYPFSDGHVGCCPVVGVSGQSRMEVGRS